MKVKAPRWPPGQQTDGELLRYREQLQAALPTLPAGSSEYSDHERRLNAVMSEQGDRRRRRAVPYS
jgi:hypothetical protein